MVWLGSAFVCARTMGAQSDKAAATLPGELIKHIIAEEEMVVTLIVTRPG
jgi:hypothetical protein